jgi:hypothetical protein
MNNSGQPNLIRKKKNAAIPEGARRFLMRRLVRAAVARCGSESFADRAWCCGDYCLAGVMLNVTETFVTPTNESVCGYALQIETDSLDGFVDVVLVFCCLAIAQSVSPVISSGSVKHRSVLSSVCCFSEKKKAAISRMSRGAS